jgi:hypothetical protein
MEKYNIMFDKKEYMKEYFQKNKDTIRKQRKEYHREYMKEYNKKYFQRPDVKEHRKEYKKEYQIKYNYKISLEEFKILLEKQESKCAICSHIFTPGDKVCIDHDHTNEKVRGLLCNNYNTALGLMKDDSEILMNAIRYLESNKFRLF